LRGAPTRFGGVLDSVVDRYSELLILGGLLIYFTGLQDSLSILLTYLAAADPCWYLTSSHALKRPDFY
jgi:phosphatidylglycerophosphate synthase